MTDEGRETFAQPYRGGQKLCQKRNPGFDLIRSCAIFCVIGGHFFSIHTAFRSTVFSGGSMFVQGVFNFFFSMGVPLFILLTGYLNATKTVVSKKYYRGMIRVLVSYLLFSVITIVFRKYYLHTDLSWLQWILKIFDFSAIPYGWYIEMWIGLFLLTPFLNMLYRAIATQREKQALLVTLFLLTALPDLLNRYGLHLVPGFWQQCFPLTYYFAGLYIREYQPVISWRWGTFLILAICLVNPIFNVLFVRDHTMIQVSGGCNGVLGMPMAVLFFLMCYRLDIQNQVARWSLMKVSTLSLDMYLCCFIFDSIYYPWFKERYFVDQSQFGKYFLIIVPMVFVSSLLLAQIKDSVQNLFKKRI